MTEVTQTLIEIRKKELKVKRLTSQKKPRSDAKANHIGVEVEFFAPRDKYEDLQDLLIEFDVDKYCCIKSDSSISANRSNHKTCEINILFQESKMEEVLAKICQVLEKIEAKVNKSCGLHVHLDVRYRNAGKVFHNLSLNQGLLYAMCPRSRKENDYCKEIPTATLDYAVKHYDRYLGINPHAVSKYKTVECRIHSGTIEFQKIFNWVTLLLKIADSDSLDIPNNLSQIKENLDLSESLVTYIKERIAKFYPTSPFLIT